MRAYSHGRMNARYYACADHGIPHPDTLDLVLGVWIWGPKQLILGVWGVEWGQYMPYLQIRANITCVLIATVG
jgi:hypothetical protein